MKILALDLSLTATGVVVVERADELDALCRVLHRETIKTPRRGPSEPEGGWNRARYRYFLRALDRLWMTYLPDVIVTEVTEHAYTVVTKGGQRQKSSRGIEYRAGYGLGRAIGWLDGALTAVITPTYEQIAASRVKLRVAGAQAASKDAVRDGLKTYFKVNVDDWPEAESDALAVAVAWLRELKHAEALGSHSGTQVLNQLATDPHPNTQPLEALEKRAAATRRRRAAIKEGIDQLDHAAVRIEETRRRIRGRVTG